MSLERTTRLDTDQRKDLTVVRERAVLVGVELNNSPVSGRESLRELVALTESAGAEVVASVFQRRQRIDAKTFIGRGKVEELADCVREHRADVIIFDEDLSPTQLRELEQATACRVIDRSELILDIFASRARTHEARLQVELAQLEYTAPRLRGMWTHLERIAGAGGGTGAGTVGGIGTRGPGERQIEIDRRIVSRRVTQLKRQIAEIDRRKIRQVRARHEHFNISLVGYTNAGKSTLMNTLTDAGVLTEDRLFATLDTKTRRWELGGGDYALLSDTVGFIQRLPHHLVASFRATLEEAIHADLLLHVVEASSPHALLQYQAVNGVLKDLGCADHRALVLLNKIDIVEDPSMLLVLRKQLPDSLEISARTGAGLDELVERIRPLVAGEPRQVTLKLKTSDGRAIAFIERHARVLDRRYLNHSVEMDVIIGSTHLTRLRENHPATQVVPSA
ncbi:MAG TPA: GTPase HflX [Phycisphaerae bacterium]|nr:GTPase HflX [Phycisphaerae bacterium]